PSLEETVAFKRQFIKRADDKPVTRIEIRKAAAAAQIEAVLYNSARSVSRIVIDRFRKSVRGAERQASRKPLIGGEPKPILIRITAALALSDIRQPRIG